ncbi:MAG: heparan-alpha-glucosaminide N-acetyltransferase domain-containing protein [Promethearchaeota archaeon]
MQIKRIKSIDIFRGLGMVYIMVGHMIDWWSHPVDDWLFYVYVSLFSALGAAGFVFISGVSTMISYRKRIEKTDNQEDYSTETIKKEYFIRALLILGLALVYNCIVAIEFLDPLNIWKWFIILTVAMCLLLAWPFLRTSKLVRIISGCLIWIVHLFILAILRPYEGEKEIYGILFYFFYNSLDQNPILSFFTFFLIGTVIGDILYDYSLIDNEIERKKAFKRNILIPLLLSGTILIILGISFLLPDLYSEKILTINTKIWWLLYTLGLDLIIILIFFTFEVFVITKPTKSYKFLFYFSYYSLSLFLLQNVNFFLFNGLLFRYNIWYFIIATVILYGIFLRFIYIKLERRFSLKVQIGQLAVKITRKGKILI